MELQYNIIQTIIVPKYPQARLEITIFTLSSPVWLRYTPFEIKLIPTNSEPTFSYLFFINPILHHNDCIVYQLGTGTYQVMLRGLVLL